MMTIDMDRLPTAPGPDSPRTSGRSADGAGRPGAPQPPHRAPADEAAPDQSRTVRRIVAGVVIGALTMFGVATLDTFAGATVPVLGTFAALPAPDDEPEVVEVPAPPSQPGTCLSWSRADAADAQVVDCTQPHLFEQSGSIAVTDQPTLPDDRQWRQLVKERCTPVVLKYLNNKFDPDGRYRVGALKPSSAKWTEGDRELRCGLQSASQSGALYPIAGKVADGDQASVQEPGTCLAIDGREIGDPVDCAKPHAVETVGIVDVSKKFASTFPAVADQDAFLQPECDKVAKAYAGSPDAITQKKLTVYWDNITQDSWDAGTRKVNCNLAALLPDRSGFAPVTGSVKGAVAVGSTPAPPASDTPDPGVPAPPTTEPAPTTEVTPSAPAPSPTETVPPSETTPPPIVDVPVTIPGVTP
jgi:Septum formation